MFLFILFIIVLVTIVTTIHVMDSNQSNYERVQLLTQVIKRVENCDYLTQEQKTYKIAQLNKAINSLQ